MLKWLECAEEREANPKEKSFWCPPIATPNGLIHSSSPRAEWTKLHYGTKACRLWSMKYLEVHVLYWTTTFFHEWSRLTCFSDKLYFSKLLSRAYSMNENFLFIGPQGHFERWCLAGWNQSKSRRHGNLRSLLNG